MPIRSRDETEVRAASFDRVSGQPANLLAMAEERRDRRDVEIPRGLRNIPEAASGETGRGDSAAAAASRDATVDRSSETGTVGFGAPRQAGRLSSAGTANSTAAFTASTRLEEPTGKPETAAALPRPVSRSEITRVEHPANGSFDVVILQSRATDDLLDVGGTLSGSPVYTVYLAVGDRKEWRLEYCVPTVRRPGTPAYQRSIEDGSPVMPPYALSTAIPTGILTRVATRQLVFHGFLGSNGTLQDMNAHTADDPLASQILALLGEWRFRPATRSDKAIDIEVLLVIPRG
jgi:hypothetical protein